MKLAQAAFKVKDLEGLFKTSYTGKSITDIVGGLLPYLFAGAGALLFVYLVLGGLELLFSLGDPKKIASAKGKISNGLLGILVVFFAYLIVQAVGVIFKTPGIQNIFGK